MRVTPDSIGSLYAVYAPKVGIVKVGFTTRPLAWRVEQLNQELWARFVPIALSKGHSMREEWALHRKLTRFRVQTGRYAERLEVYEPTDGFFRALKRHSGMRVRRVMLGRSRRIGMILPIRMPDVLSS